MMSLVALLVSSGVVLGMECSQVYYSLQKVVAKRDNIWVVDNPRFQFSMDPECNGGDMVSVSWSSETKFLQSQLEKIMEDFKTAGTSSGVIQVDKNVVTGVRNSSSTLFYLNVSKKNIEQVVALKTARERLCKLQSNNGQPVRNLRVLGKHEVIGALDQAHFTTLHGSPYLQYKDQAGKDVRMPISEDDIKAIGQALELNRETVKALGMFFTPDPSTSTGENTLNYNRFVDLADVQGISKTVRMYKWFIRGGIAVSIGALLAAIYHFSQR
jgi:hypothetical protein